MSRQVPTVRRKEVVYRRSYIDDHNQRFDQIFEKPIVVMRTHTNDPLVVNNLYNSDTEQQLQKVNNKLDSILNHLQTPKTETLARPEQVFIDKWDGQIAKIKEICDRLEKLENSNDSGSKTVATSNDFSTLNSRIEQLSQNQQELEKKVSSINGLGNDSIDEVLSVINETRRDLEEKIFNVKQLCDGNWAHLDKKMDEFQRQQKGIQHQINELMSILTSLGSSRPSSVNEKILSRSSSKSSIKPILVNPTARSPAPRPPSLSSSTRSVVGSNSQNPIKTTNLGGSVRSVATEKTVESTKKIIVVDTPNDKNLLEVSQVLEKAKSMEVLIRQLSLETIPLEHKNKSISSRTSTSSGSFIEPLIVDERRNSQPANVFQNKNKI